MKCRTSKLFAKKFFWITSKFFVFLWYKTTGEISFHLYSTSLCFPEAEGQKLEDAREEIPELVTLGQEYAEAIWTPDIYFPDAVNIERPGKGHTSFQYNNLIFDQIPLRLQKPV